MQGIMDSLRRSLVFNRIEGGEDGGSGSSSSGIVDKIGHCIRKSRAGFLPKTTQRESNNPSIRWRKGELIGCGAFGRVYMGMNLDCGELLAVKEVSIATNSESKEKAQAHIRELEEEVKLLKNLSHPNIVVGALFFSVPSEAKQYLGTATEDDTLNILLEFVPGGSISSLLGKFGSFPEACLLDVFVLSMKSISGLAKIWVVNLVDAHRCKDVSRSLFGANILVDNKGCIKLADFGASKQVVELATVSGAKSMKGTPYWMAPEVILQTGHSFEKLSTFYALERSISKLKVKLITVFKFLKQRSLIFKMTQLHSFYRSLGILAVSLEDINFLTTAALLQTTRRQVIKVESTDTFSLVFKLIPSSADIWSVGCTVIEMVTGKPPWSQQYKEVAALFYVGTTKSHPPIPEHFEPSLRPSASELLQENSAAKMPSPGPELNDVSADPDRFSNIQPIWGTSASEDMCQIDDDFNMNGSMRPDSRTMMDPFKSFNPMSEPVDDSRGFDGIMEHGRMDLKDSSELAGNDISCCGPSGKVDNGFTFPCGQPASEDDEEVTESKIRAFLDEKALDLKKLQNPLYEFYNTLNIADPSNVAGKVSDDSNPKFLKLPPKSRSPSRVASGPSTPLINAANTASTSSGSGSRHVSSIGVANNQSIKELSSPQLNEWKELLENSVQEPHSPSMSCTERQRKWKEELDQELERKRELMRQAGMGGKTASPKERVLNRQKERLRIASPGK
ncbi:hypothetical protein ACLOJK_026006 [Asimina triloba]